jgi:hypothetical protein
MGDRSDEDAGGEVELILARRKFLTGALSLLAAPAVVRASSLMPVKAFKFEPRLYIIRTSLPPMSWRIFYQCVPIREVDVLYGVLPWLPGDIERGFEVAA